MLMTNLQTIVANSQYFFRVLLYRSSFREQVNMYIWCLIASFGADLAIFISCLVLEKQKKLLKRSKIVCY